MKARMNTLIRTIILLLSSAFILLATCAIGTTFAIAEEPTQQPNQGVAPSGFKIKVNVDQVAVGTSVFGRPASELKEDDFIIYDNGISQTASYVSRDQFPLAIALMIDRSPSIGEYLPMLQVATLSAMRLLKPEDEVVLFSFDVYRQRLTDLTRDRQRIVEELKDIKVANQIGTIMYDTIAEAASYLKKEAPNSQHAIILFSDNFHYVLAGAGYGSGGYSADAARTKALEAAATVYSIRTPMSDGKFIETESNEKIKWIAEETGGQQLELKNINSVKTALEKVISNLRMQYTLWFSPTNTGEKGSFHKLAVKLTNPNRCPDCRLLTRAGYYSGIAAPSPSLKALRPSLQEVQKITDESLIKRSVVAVAAANLELQEIPFQITTTGHTSTKGQTELQVDLQIDISGIEFKEVEGKYSCRLRVAMFYANDKGRILGSDWRIIEGELSEETYNFTKKTGISFSVTIPVKTQNQMLKVVVYDEGSDKVGSKLVNPSSATSNTKSGS
jgi:Ca-activated chloride channel family protein